MAEPGFLDGTEKIEVLKVLYPIFKREVFDRREAIIRLATFGDAVLLGLLLLTASRLLDWGGEEALRWTTVTGIVIFTSGIIHRIQQQRVRHFQAKQGLVEIEKALQLFQENTYLPGKSLYPLDWQSPPRTDWNVAVSTLSLVGFTVLVVLTFAFA